MSSTNTNELHVIFGSGPLGLAVMSALLRRGRKVRLVNRSGAANVPAEVELLAGDAFSLDFTRHACQKAAVVYQCAQPLYWEWPEKFPPLQAAILEGAASARAKLIVGENLYMYGEVSGPIREDLPYAAQTRKGRVRAEMAQAVLEAHRSEKVRAASARGSDFYGPLVTSSALGDRAILPVLSGKTASLGGNLDLPHAFTYITDFGEAMAILGEQEAALGQAWHVPNPPALTQRQMITLFFEQAGFPPRVSAMGKTMLRIGGIFIPGAREMIEMMYEFEQPFVVDSSKFVRAFGDIATPYPQAVAETLAWYRKHFMKED
jgi:nucleoside-diphosphate-sugar epimerase